MRISSCKETVVGKLNQNWGWLSRSISGNSHQIQTPCSCSYGGSITCSRQGVSAWQTKLTITGVWDHSLPQKDYLRVHWDSVCIKECGTSHEVQDRSFCPHPPTKSHRHGLVWVESYLLFRISSGPVFLVYSWLMAKHKWNKRGKKNTLQNFVCLFFHLTLWMNLMAQDGRINLWCFQEWWNVALTALSGVPTVSARLVGTTAASRAGVATGSQTGGMEIVIC